MLDVIKDEFERLGIREINAVQALLPFDIGDNEVTAGELGSRCYYQGTNVSYNLKKLVDNGFIYHQRCEIDCRSVRVRLTEKGREVDRVVSELLEHHASGLDSDQLIGGENILTMNKGLQRFERFWSDISTESVCWRRGVSGSASCLR